jgi:hypothetical protein
VEISVEAYAALMVELAAAAEARAAVLAKHGLDEAGWERVDTHWQGQLSAALDVEGDGVGPVLSAFTVAYEGAQRALAPPITLEQFARVTRLLLAGDDPRAATAKSGVSLSDYTHGSEHWTRQLVTDPDLERRFDELVHRGD